MSGPRPIVLVIGPTAGGKTELAIALAERLPGGGECIGADSMQVYCGMDIGTAKPSAAQRAAVPHHLLDVADPADGTFSVDQWLARAEQAIAGIRSRGRWPIVVGGTNLYVQALLYGLCDAPAPDGALREHLSSLGSAELHGRLSRVDPESAWRIHPSDRRRAIRAIEVFERTGQPLSALQREWQPGRLRRDAIIVSLEFPVAETSRRINARVRAMFQAGLVAEVEGLRRTGRLGPQAAQALGYRQVLEHLEGRLDLEETIEQVKIRTRRFAKRQRTWLRRFGALPGSIRLDVADKSLQDLVDKTLTSIIPATAPAAGAATSPSAGHEKANDHG